MSKDFKQLGYFDELRKDVLEAWMKSERGVALEQQVMEIIASQMKDVAQAQYSAADQEEKARLTLLIRDKINEGGLLKSLPANLLDFVNSEEWKDRISKDLDSMKSAIENQKMQSSHTTHTTHTGSQDVYMEEAGSNRES